MSGERSAVIFERSEAIQLSRSDKERRIFSSQVVVTRESG